jgi:hypothetical protein
LVQARGGYLGPPWLGTAVPCGQLGIFAGWNKAQGGVRTSLVIVLAPILDFAPRILQRQEPVSIQTLVAQASVEDSGQYSEALLVFLFGSERATQSSVST